MRSNIYKEGTLYHFEPKQYIDQIQDAILMQPHGEIGVSTKGIEELEFYKSGLQLLDENNSEVFSYNKPENAPSHYSNVDLITMFTNQETTMFLDEKIVEGNVYTYLLFLDTARVNRVSYTYDVNALREAHDFPVLIIINIIAMLMMSFLFTRRITRPINRMIDKIINLSKGDYSKSPIKQGIYFKVEDRLNQLAERLTTNEDERIKIEQMREEWICNITHDIKTPLTSIIGNAEILADTEYEVSDEMRQKYCDIILNKSQYIKTLVEDLNLSTRLKNNTIQLNKTKVNSVSLARHVLIDIINDEKYNDRNIAFKYSDDTIYLEVDQQLMKRVFVNLIINAFVHNGEDVKVKFEIKKEDETHVLISVEDNGSGISEIEQKEIFKRYYRGTHTRNKIEGSGLGLAIAHDIIEAHGAQMEAVSEEGEGLKINIRMSL